MPQVAADTLSFGYSSLPVLDGVSFNIETGRFVALVGPNGGGKTTLLKLLLGLLEPRKGHCKIDGKAAYVPQGLPFDRHFPITTLELVLGGLLADLPWHGGFRSRQRRAAIDALEQLGIANLAAMHVGSLSGGQFQRALIARALVSKPDVLLLDEPTANVDVEAEQAILSLLERLNMTILMVTHDLSTAIHRVDEVLLVQREVTALQPKQVCEHYAAGLYHAPLIDKEPS